MAKRALRIGVPGEQFPKVMYRFRRDPARYFFILLHAPEIAAKEENCHCESNAMVYKRG